MIVPGLSVSLFEHQKNAISWMIDREGLYRGGILGLGMGSGKTLTTLSLIVLDKLKRVEQPFITNLIVVPACVIDQWCEEEIALRTNLKYFKYYGDVRKRLWSKVDRDVRLRNDNEEYNDCESTKQEELSSKSILSVINFLSQFDIVITTYTTIILDAQLFVTPCWHRIILDEGHAIKNIYSQRSKIIRSLKANYRWCLTGTPLSNTIDELWAIAAFLRLKEARTKHTFELYVKKGFIHQILRQSSVEELLALNLPKLTYHTLTINLLPLELDAYNQIFRSTKKSVQSALQSGGKKKQRRHIFSLLMQLRRSASHLGCELPKNMTTSSKFAMTKATIEKIWKNYPGEKIILFSNFVSIIKLYESYFAQENIKNIIYHGGLDLKQRKNALSIFKNDPDITIIMISLAAGYSGINITDASHVIFSDMSYNPMVDKQAIARSYRIKQTLPVHVYKLISAKTVDEKVMKIQQKKIRLIDKVLGSKDNIRIEESEDLSIGLTELLDDNFE